MATLALLSVIVVFVFHCPDHDRLPAYAGATTRAIPLSGSVQLSRPSRTM